MRCSCQLCGEYMVQDEKGLFSRCVCPNCFAVCSACMGTGAKPLSAEDIQALLMERSARDGERTEE